MGSALLYSKGEAVIFAGLVKFGVGEEVGEANIDLNLENLNR
jgi:hypothetical protein